jgi:hypothetical protein
MVTKTVECSSGNVPFPQMSAFSRNVMAMLERVEYRRCETGEDLEAIYRLRYDSFRAHGLLLSEAPDHQMSDELDEAPNCYRFGVFLDNVLVSTVRLHHLTAETPFAPIMTVFGDILRPRLQRGETFIDPSRLAIDPELAATNRALPYLTLRLAVIANAYFDTTSCVSMIREEHTAFYSRVFGSVPVCPPRLYPPFTMPIYFYESRCDTNMESTVRRYPFFGSTQTEQRLLFATPSVGEPATLTVLPTARYARLAA